VEIPRFENNWELEELTDSDGCEKGLDDNEGERVSTPWRSVDQVLLRIVVTIFWWDYVTETEHYNMLSEKLYERHTLH
jgi:hypothetical protein